MGESKPTPGPYDVFVGNANGRGLIRIETAYDAPEAGIVIATTTRGPQSEATAMLLAASFDMMQALTGGCTEPGEIATVGALSWVKSAIDALSDLDKAKAEREEDPLAFAEMVLELHRLVERGNAALAKAGAA